MEGEKNERDSENVYNQLAVIRTHTEDANVVQQKQRCRIPDNRENATAGEQ